MIDTTKYSEDVRLLLAAKAGDGKSASLLMKKWGGCVTIARKSFKKRLHKINCDQYYNPEEYKEYAEYAFSRAVANFSIEKSKNLETYTFYQQFSFYLSNENRDRIHEIIQRRENEYLECDFPCNDDAAGSNKAFTNAVSQNSPTTDPYDEYNDTYQKKAFYESLSSVRGSLGEFDSRIFEGRLNKIPYSTLAKESNVTVGEVKRSLQKTAVALNMELSKNCSKYKVDNPYSKAMKNFL